MTNSKRTAQWGHWGITFFWQTDGQYAPDKIEGVLYFPVGNCGPMDGFMGSPEREGYKRIIAAWTSGGVLPEKLHAV